MYTIGKLARKFGIARSTLLYYDRKGLLHPRSHAKGEYRLYSEEEAARLERIRQYRDAGLSLSDIRLLLEKHKSEGTREILEERLRELNQEIIDLREQQHVLARLLGHRETAKGKSFTKASWTELLRSAGFSESDMLGWHVRFEKNAPQKHVEFLRKLRIPEAEIDEIRRRIQGK
jgi:DNA-binding transcriptional MerR regulator